MPHDFSAEIEAAFAAYEQTRPKVVNLAPLRFESGPYFPPPVGIGDWVECAYYGEVRVVGWSAGPLPWPQCHISGPRSLVLFADLVRAVEEESALAVALAWGVSRVSVHKWRRYLGVAPANAGSLARWKSNVEHTITPAQNEAGLQLAHGRASRIKAEATKSAGPGLRQPWSAEAVGWMGVLSDAEIARRVGCDAQTVGLERRRHGIASVGHSGPWPDLRPLDGARVRARRYALDLTQAQLGLRLGCNAARVSRLESCHSPMVTPQTLDKLARALGCAPNDLRPPDALTPGDDA